MIDARKRFFEGILSLAVALTLSMPIAAQVPPQPGKNRPPQGNSATGPAANNRPPSELYTIEQSVSEKAQMSTIAFSALAFMTGTFGADTFLPPGKAADYFGFQYMRDIDVRAAGHNMMFLTNAANNVLAVLTDQQKEGLLALAKAQAPLFEELGRKRLLLIRAFRDAMEGRAPKGSVLSAEAVQEYVAGIFELDGKLACGRAVYYGALMAGLSAAQKEAMGRLVFADSATWPEIPDQLDKRRMTHAQDILVMTYASEFLSWYSGSEKADVYFCPERHGTYFGGFYMKDYPAIGNRDYYIPTALTGDAGEAFLQILDSVQREQIVSLWSVVPQILGEILSIRTAISRELRLVFRAEVPSEATILELSRRYGRLDGLLSYKMAVQFIAVYQSLTASQKTSLIKLRNQDVFPDGYYLYADLIKGTYAGDAKSLFIIR